MHRWFTALLYALMLACMAMPVVAQVDIADQQQSSNLSSAVIDADDGAGDPSGSIESKKFVQADDAVDLPDWIGARPTADKLDLSPQALPCLCPVLTASPHLEGPQRPPRIQPV
jgi:hypothetical protein